MDYVSAGKKKWTRIRADLKIRVTYLIGRRMWGFEREEEVGGFILKKRGSKMEDDGGADKLFSG